MSPTHALWFGDLAQLWELAFWWLRLGQIAISVFLWNKLANLGPIDLTFKGNYVLLNCIVTGNVRLKTYTPIIPNTPNQNPNSALSMMVK